MQHGPLAELSSMPHALAEVVKTALEAEGIPVKLDREALSTVYGLDSGTFATRLWVPVERLDEARTLIAEARQAN